MCAKYQHFDIIIIILLLSLFSPILVDMYTSPCDECLASHMTNAFFNEALIFVHIVSVGLSEMVEP